MVVVIGCDYVSEYQIHGSVSERNRYIRFSQVVRNGSHFFFCFLVVISDHSPVEQMQNQLVVIMKKVVGASSN